MTRSSIVWIAYRVLLAYWWGAAIYAAWRVRREPAWRPAQWDRFQQAFGMKISNRSYVRLIFFGAILGTLGAFWFPELFISALEHR
ncbi:MAG TPA: hypothetical protein VGO11_12330 [Chthoniobacteraceae bacterium]|jgi:hypothetical protein|nr:hypothetical protein [Chthoniobacteraceae bacterium]